MLIHVNPKYYARGKTGKGKFAQRLVKAWREMGVEITDDPKVKADIALNIGRMNYSSKAKRNVLRVGPANINTNMNWKRINHEKAQSVKRADAIVYQSRYSKKVYHKLVCNPDKPEAIIFNGADPRDCKFNPIIPDSSNGPIFLASTRVWLKQKRLKQIVKAFINANINNSLLSIFGDDQGIGKKYKMYNNIAFHGNAHPLYVERTLGSPTRTAMIHLTWIDACPNSVVEALVAGLPVICTNQGGTHELIEANDKTMEACTIIRHDPEFKYKPVNLDKPPKSDRLTQMLIGAMKRYVHEPVRVEAPHLHIENIAQQYLKFFEKIL